MRHRIKNLMSKFNHYFPLLADTDKTFGKAYGAIGGGGFRSIVKAMAHCVTFIIDDKSKIVHVIDPITQIHADEVLALL